jgi:hypothetical protein
VKILIAPANTAGYYSGLLFGLRAMGVDCDLATPRRHGFKYWEPTESRSIRLIRGLADLQLPKKSTFLRLATTLLRQASWALWSITAIARYDTFIFSFGKSLWPGNLDLFLMGILGRTVISNIGHGSEARPAFMDGALRESLTGNPPAPQEIRKQCRKTARMVARHEKFASAIIALPTTSQFLSKPYVNFLCLGLPIMPNASVVPKISQATSPKGTTAVRVLHAPSHFFAKGTAEILEAISFLKEKGHAIDFVLLSNSTHAEVMREIEKCDFVIDQAYSDIPLPMLSAEAATFGKPSVVGGYGLRALEKVVPSGMWPPTRKCLPQDIEETVEDLIVNADERENLGCQAAKYARTHLNPIEVAKRYLMIIRGEIPETWTLEPDEFNYLSGIGQTEQMTRANILAATGLGGRATISIRRKQVKDDIVRFVSAIKE